MVAAFEQAQGSLAERLLAALDAAEREGGDLRGRQAAGLVIASGASSGMPRRDVVIDVRVDDHPEPVEELKRLVRHAQAHVRANRAMERLLAGDADAALPDLDASCAAAPEEPTFHFRRALALLSLQRVGEAREALHFASAIHPGWNDLLLRFADAGLVPVPREKLAALVGVQAGGVGAGTALASQGNGAVHASTPPSPPRRE
jgi:hypothetical protein